MLHPPPRVVPYSQPRLLVAAALLLFGCSSKALTGDGNSDARIDVPTDTGLDGPASIDTRIDGTPDAAACGCHLDGYTLVMSWECFCSAFGCTLPPPVCSGSRRFTTSCDLVTETLLTIGGPYIVVWDATGAVVGRQLTTDTTYFKCPSDASLEAGIVRAGQFPDATCGSISCDCVDGGATCPVLPALDAGTDAGPPHIDGGPITLDAPMVDGGGADVFDAGVGCTGQYPFCVAGSPGGVCNDVGQAPTCSNGVWVCPSGTIPTSQCACFGVPPPGCTTCTSSGWLCSDGGRD